MRGYPHPHRDLEENIPAKASGKRRWKNNTIKKGIWQWGTSLQIKTFKIFQLCLLEVTALLVGGWRLRQRRQSLGHRPLCQVHWWHNSYMAYLHGRYYQDSYINTLTKVKLALLFQIKFIIHAEIRISVPHHHGSHLTATDKNTSGFSKQLSKDPFSFRHTSIPHSKDFLSALRTRGLFIYKNERQARFWDVCIHCRSVYQPGLSSQK